MEKPITEGRLTVIYSNAVQFHTSIHDFSLLFGLQQPSLDPEDKKLIVSPLVRVLMSPPHFKRFAEVVAEQLKKYEAKHGKISTQEAKPVKKKKRTKKH